MDWPIVIAFVAFAFFVGLFVGAAWEKRFQERQLKNALSGRAYNIEGSPSYDRRRYMLYLKDFLDYEHKARDVKAAQVFYMKYFTGERLQDLEYSETPHRWNDREWVGVKADLQKIIEEARK